MAHGQYSSRCNNVINTRYYIFAKIIADDLGCESIHVPDMLISLLICDASSPLILSEMKACMTGNEDIKVRIAEECSEEISQVTHCAVDLPAISTLPYLLLTSPTSANG